nr:GNAT family N-acetyltransferase [Solirhodobacter olei]
MLLYEAIDANPNTVLLVDERQGMVMGFVAGGNSMGTIYRSLLRRPLALGFALAPHLVRPGTLRGIVELISRSRAVDRRDGTAIPVLPSHELFSIVVAPSARGTGVAETLINALSDHFRAQAVGAFRIVVGAALSPAHRFYLRMGAEPIARTEVHAGAGSIVYVMKV